LPIISFDITIAIPFNLSPRSSFLPPLFSSAYGLISLPPNALGHGVFFHNVFPRGWAPSQHPLFFAKLAPSFFRLCPPIRPYILLTRFVSQSFNTNKPSNWFDPFRTFFLLSCLKRFFPLLDDLRTPNLFQLFLFLFISRLLAFLTRLFFVQFPSFLSPQAASVVAFFPYALSSLRFFPRHICLRFCATYFFVTPFRFTFDPLPLCSTRSTFASRRSSKSQNFARQSAFPPASPLFLRTPFSPQLVYFQVAARVFLFWSQFRLALIVVLPQSEILPFSLEILPSGAFVS